MEDRCDVAMEVCFVMGREVNRGAGAGRLQPFDGFYVLGLVGSGTGTAVAPPPFMAVAAAAGSSCTWGFA